MITATTLLSIFLTISVTYNVVQYFKLQKLYKEFISQLKILHNAHERATAASESFSQHINHVIESRKHQRGVEVATILGLDQVDKEKNQENKDSKQIIA